jgi:hypothetical protein
MQEVPPARDGRGAIEQRACAVLSWLQPAPNHSAAAAGTVSDRHDDIRCSFCGKDQSEVKHLVAGPKAFICDECVVLAVRIIADGDPARFDQLIAQARALPLVKPSPTND